MIPRAEVDALTRSLAEVLALAEDGQVVDGHELLIWGLERAEALRDEGVLWGDELVSCWRWAIADFSTRYGLSQTPAARAIRWIERPLKALQAAVSLLAVGLAVAWLASPWQARDWGQPLPLGAPGGSARGPNLRGAILANATLQGVDLAGVDLRGIDLQGAVLAGSSLLGADLTGADLTGADLTGADLTDADLTGVRLDGAILKGARLDGADVSGSLGLFAADLSQARYDPRTRWPPGFNPAERGAVLVQETVPRAAAPTPDPRR